MYAKNVPAPYPSHICLDVMKEAASLVAVSTILRFAGALSFKSSVQCAFLSRSIHFGSLSKQRISMALKANELANTKALQDCPLRPYRSKPQNDGLNTATFALG
jgi:hypothetical protein